MFKRSYFYFILFIILLALSIKYSPSVQYSFLKITDSIKSSYLEAQNTTIVWIQKYFRQAATIEELKDQAQENRRLELILLSLSQEVESLLSSIGATKRLKSEATLTQVLSYVKLGDYHKVWLNADLNSSEKIYGLVQNRNVAGIAMQREGRTLGLLNGDERCNYSVFIGSKKAPGIVKGRDSEDAIIVDYIPSWMDIGPGDEVYTSGLDMIFFKGIKVGEVKEVRKSQGYKIAIVAPYADIYNPELLYLIDIQKHAHTPTSEINETMKLKTIKETGLGLGIEE